MHASSAPAKQRGTDTYRPERVGFNSAGAAEGEGVRFRMKGRGVFRQPLGRYSMIQKKGIYTRSQLHVIYQTNARYRHRSRMR